MDFLNRRYAELVDLFRSMSVGARITTALLLAVVIVGAGYLFRAQGAGPELDLFNGMPVPASHLSAMLAAFGKAGLSDYEVRGTQILVPRGKQSVYMAALADAKALPPNFGSAIGEAISDGNVFESTADKERRMQVAKQQSLSQIIGSMQGIESAYVFFATDAKGGLRREQVKTASVSVKPLAGRQLGEEDVAKIRHLVAGAFGMKWEDVTVADLNGRVYYGGAEGGGSAENNVYVALTKNWEQYYRTKILNSLSWIPDLTVEPTVVLDKERLSRVRRVELNPKTVPIQTRETTVSRVNEGGGPAGRVGYEAQQPNRPQALASAASAQRQQEDESTTDGVYLPQGSQEESENVGLTPTRVAVSVGIPSSYLEKVYRERNPAADGQAPKPPDQAALDTLFQEISASVREHVAALLPPAAGVSDLKELVKVSQFTAIAGEPAPKPDVAQRILTWLGDYWPTLGLLALAGFSLVMLRSMIRAAPESPAAVALGPAPAGEPPVAAESESPDGEEPRLRRFQGTGRSLRDELAELVQEDPDTAANILKAWIGTVN